MVCKQSNVSWVAEDEILRTVVRESFEPKTMLSIFFNSNGVVYLSYLDKGKTIDQYPYKIIRSVDNDSIRT